MIIISNCYKAKHHTPTHSHFSTLVSVTPTDLETVRLNTGLAHVRLRWSEVPGAAGYEVFCEHLNNRSISNTTTPSVTITSGLSLSATYTVYVMSYSSEASLPSNPKVATFTLSE